MKTKYFLFSLLINLIGAYSITYAQDAFLEITGNVIESKSKNPIEFATLVIKDSKTNKNLEGTTTSEDGKFYLRTKEKDFYIEISFIGFAPTQIKDYKIVDGKVNLGTVNLSENSKDLEEVIIRADKSQTEFKLDKRVFNVGKDISSTGMSALEVLNNVPSVNVNIEGQISLRGASGVQILINGKPSVIASDESNALGTITADMIERVEVITNPSAKYDAEGTAGIINIVIKKEERNGLNGSISVNTGIPDNHSIGVSLSKRTEKFNLFSQFGVGYRELPRYGKSINTNYNTDNTIISEGTEYRNETFYNIILGTDYHINKYNVLTLTGNYTYEVEDQPSNTNYSLLVADAENAYWSRNEVTEATNPKWRYELQYKKDFKDNKEHHLLFSALGNLFSKDQSSEFTNTIESGTTDETDQLTRTNFKEVKYTFNLDYTKPFSEELTLEAGGQYVIQDVSNDYEVKNWETDAWVQDAGLTNIFEYDQKVLGTYGTFAYEGKKWGAKLGLRMENTELNTLLTNTNQDNHQNYTNFFPTLHSSLKVSKTFSLQAGYSRRIFRPRLWHLNPFFNIRNTYNIRAGNPNLKPEFTDSYELTGIYILGKTTLNAGVYYRYTTDAVERVSTYENNITTTMPMNIGINHATGVEINGKYTPNNWLSITGDFNYSYYNRQGSFNNESFDFFADRWSGKLVTKLKLPAQFELEITGNYQSKQKTVQNVYSENLFASLGIRKKLMKGKTVLNLGVRDIFESRIWESEAIENDYYLYSKGYRGRFITFGISYGIGKGEAMEYSGRRR